MKPIVGWALAAPVVVGAGGLVESLRLAGQSRMRPIAMTTIAAIPTLLPLAFAIGAGSEMQPPLAIAIISCPLLLPLVLLAMPAFHALTMPRAQRSAARPRTTLPVPA